MKVLFLDFDGVLNSKQHFLATKDLPDIGADSMVDADLFRMKRDINVNNMWVLGYILNQIPDLKIVISSAWRNYYDMESFKELFKIYKLDGSRIIGKTPRKMSSERHTEIRMWLDDQNKPEPHDCPVDISDGPCGECENAFVNNEEVDYIALDDHVIYQLGDPEKDVHEILTDPWVGLSMHEAFKIIKHFKPDFKEPVLMI